MLVGAIGLVSLGWNTDIGRPRIDSRVLRVVRQWYRLIKPVYGDDPRNKC